MPLTLFAKHIPLWRFPPNRLLISALLVNTCPASNKILLIRLLPLDGRGRFGGEVITDPVDPRDLAKDAVCNFHEHRPGHLLDVGGHRVDCVDRAQDDGVLEAARVVFHADRFKIGDDGEILPDGLVEPGDVELLAEDCVRFTHGLEALAGDRAEAADPEPGAGEGLAVDHAVGQAERGAAGAHLVLEELAQRFDKLEREVVGQAADVVVGFDHLGGLGAALDDVGIDGALREEIDPLELAGLLLEDADKLRADDLAFLFRVRDARQLAEEPLARVDVDEVCAQLVPEDPHDLFRLPLAEQAVVDVHAGELVTDGAQQERGHDRAVHAAREGEQHPAGADLSADELDLVGDEVFHVPVGLRFAGVKDEPAQQFRQLGGILRPMGQRLAPRRGVVGGERRDTERVDRGVDVDGRAVHDPVGAAVQEDAAHVGQRAQLVRRDVVRIDFAVDAQVADGPREDGVFRASQVQNNDHVLLHMLLPPMSCRAGLRAIRWSRAAWM